MVSLIAGYAIVISITLYLVNHRNILELWRGFKKFNCRRCGHCCRLLVGLSEKDIRRLERAGYKRQDFVSKRRKKYFIKQTNRYCPWMKVFNGRAECTVYKHRPEICRSYPKRKIFGLKAHDCRCYAFAKDKYLNR
jgi:Fe-S-cluster containining protein